MQYRRLGKSGLKISAIGLGTNRFGERVPQNEVNEILSACQDMGLNFLDTANVYQGGQSESSIGTALKGKRHHFIIATKVFFNVGEGVNDGGASRYHILNAVEDSLRRLQTDYIDLYQIHRWDSHTPIAETLSTLNTLVTSGKVRYIGASGFASWQMAQANLLAELRGWEPFVTVQPHYHLLERDIERELIPFCQAEDVGILPYFPLAGGFLTGKYKRGEAAPAGSRGESSEYVQKYMTAENYTKVEALTAWAEARGRSMAALAHAWLLAQPQISSVISGATKLSQVESNVKAVDWSLSEAEVAEVNAILNGEAG